MKNILFVAVLFVFSFSATLKAQNSADEILEIFFEYYSQNKTDDAIDYVFSTNKYLQGAEQQIVSIKEKLKTVTSVIGPYFGYEKILEKKLGESYVFIKCMVKHDRQPLFFTFMLYKPDKIWQLQSLRFDDKLEDSDMNEFINILQK